MMLSGKDDLIGLVKKIAEQLNNDKLHSIWTQFAPYSFAIYNKELVYLYSEGVAPSGFIADSGIYVGSWNESFVGNTAIEYDGQLIAIWDQSSITPATSFDELYSSIVHEMFHCYQEEKGIFRSGNELQLLLYPFTTQNIATRLEERKYLLRAVFAENSEIKRSLVAAFIQLREQRRKWIGENLQYELAVESNEGTATYVEYKTRVTVSELPSTYLLAQFGKDLVEIPETLKTFRASCYPSGLYIALLLDYYVPNWQAEYESTDGALYDLLVRCFDRSDVILPTVDMSIAHDLIEKDRTERNVAYQQFIEQSGYRITLRGSFKVTGIDPMNMLRLENHILHRHFLKLRCNDQELFLTGLILTRLTEDLWKTDEVQINTSIAPNIDNDVVTLEGVVKITGKVNIDGNHFIVNCD